MGGIRFPRADRLSAALSLLLLCAAMPARAAAPLRDAPVIWYADDRCNVTSEIAERDPNLVWNAINESMLRPVSRWTKPSRLVRHVGVLFGGDHVPRAADVNTLDEAPNSSWFTNRIGLFSMTPDEVFRGPVTDAGPDTTSIWTVVSAKTQGVTPGFNIRDGRGIQYVIKFDPPGYPNISTAAGVIANRIFYAAGYNVPADVIVYFRRDQLVLGENVQLKLLDGSRRTMTVEDLEEILAKVYSSHGRWRALASRWLEGRPLGPFSYTGRRKDDPNDHVDHQQRRALRGLKSFAGWVNHFDTKELNSLDMLVDVDGRHFVRHYLIDLASTLGAGATGPTHEYGYEFALDLPPIFGRLFALGIHEDTWRQLERPPGLDEVGTFESDLYDPRDFKPLEPNSAFANLTTRDAYWAAKIISAFTDEHLLAACEAGQYENPDATRYVALILGQRRDEIARCWFDKIPPLEYFAQDGRIVVYHDLGAERGIYPESAPRYRVRVAAVTAERSPARFSEWLESERTEIDLADPRLAAAIDDADPGTHPFLAIECRVKRSTDWSGTVTAYLVRANGRVVAVDRP